MESCGKENKIVMTREVRSFVKELVVDVIWTMAKEAPHEVVRKTFQNAQIGVQFVVCNIVEQVVLELLRKDVTENAEANFTRL